MPCADSEVGTEEMKGYRKVLIAVNGSLDVLKTGLKVAQDEGCWVTVLKVIPPNEGELHLTGIKNVEDVLISGADHALREIRNIARSEGTIIKTRIETGNISSRILEVAEEENCDLIIVGAKKEKGIKRLFSDKVVKKLIDQSPCPVLVVGNEYQRKKVPPKVADFQEAR